MVYNTVAHIQDKASKTYTLNTSNMIQMMIIVLAFLLSNGLLSNPDLWCFLPMEPVIFVQQFKAYFAFFPSKSSWTVPSGKEM